MPPLDLERVTFGARGKGGLKRDNSDNLVKNQKTTFREAGPGLNRPRPVDGLFTHPSIMMMTGTQEKLPEGLTFDGF